MMTRCFNVKQVIASSFFAGFSLLSVGHNAMAAPWGVHLMGCRNEDRGVGTFNVNVTDQRVSSAYGGIRAESRFFPESKTKVHNSAPNAKRMVVNNIRSVGRVPQESFRVRGEGIYVVENPRTKTTFRFPFDGTVSCLPSPRPPIG
jgi:hypothetical protein